MKNKFKYPTRALLFLTFLLLMIACKPSSPFIHTPISGAMIIDTREQEIIFDKPFKPKKTSNKICFAYSDKLNAESISEPPRFTDGTSLKLTISVIAENGRKYELDSIENSVENYLCIYPKTKDWSDISKTDTVFIKVIVHSNREINVSKIEWVSYDIWDI